MLKETKKIVLLGVIALLILMIIAAFMLAPAKPEVIAIDKNSNIVTDGEYIFFNDPDGNVMKMHAFDTTPEVWLGGDWRVLSVSDKNLVLQKDNKSITVFNREEKGIEETYNVKTDTAYCTDGAVYYKDSKTDYIMQIDRKTKEEAVFFNHAVNDFVIFDNKLFIAQAEKDKGIAMFDYSAGTAAMYMPGKNIKKLAVADNLIAYTASKGKVRRYIPSNGDDVKVKKVKADGLCLSKGIYFYVEKTFGGYKLGMNTKDEFR